jgi:hypothetical protein
MYDLYETPKCRMLREACVRYSLHALHDERLIDVFFATNKRFSSMNELAALCLDIYAPHQPTLLLQPNPADLHELARLQQFDNTHQGSPCVFMDGYVFHVPGCTCFASGPASPPPCPAPTPAGLQPAMLFRTTFNTLPSTTKDALRATFPDGAPCTLKECTMCFDEPHLNRECRHQTWRNARRSFSPELAASGGVQKREGRGGRAGRGSRAGRSGGRVPSGLGILAGEQLAALLDTLQKRQSPGPSGGQGGGR